jgi:hypothetical protein
MQWRQVTVGVCLLVLLPLPLLLPLLLLLLFAGSPCDASA